MDFKKYFLVIGLCFSAGAFCQAQSEAPLTEPELLIVESDLLPIPVVPAFFVVPNKSSEQSVLQTMKDLNKAAFDREVSGAISKILGAVIGISLYYAFYGATKGAKVMRDFLFPRVATFKAS